MTHRDVNGAVEEKSPLTGLLPHPVDPIDSGQLLEHLTINTDVSFAALVAFATVDEFGHFGKAARFLGKQQQGLRQHVKNLEEALDTQLLATGPGGEYRAYGPVGRELRDRARLMVYQYGAIGRLGEHAIRVSYLPQHGFFMSAVEARLDGLVDLRTTTLSEEHRSDGRFYDNVVVPLAAGMLDFAIGLAPPKDSPPAELVTSHYLYSSRQEAMVPVGDRRERVTLTELVAEGRLLVPPPNARSRVRLEEEITRHVPDDPGPAARVKRESYGTKVLIQYGMKGLGTVVVPSSIAHPFYHGNDHGGPASADFKWLPVTTPCGDLIVDPVYALTRRVRDRHSKQIGRILKLVHQEVAHLELEQDPARLSRA